MQRSCWATSSRCLYPVCTHRSNMLDLLLQLPVGICLSIVGQIARFSQVSVMHMLCQAGGHKTSVGKAGPAADLQLMLPCIHVARQLDCTGYV